MIFKGSRQLKSMNRTTNQKLVWFHTEEFKALVLPDLHIFPLYTSGEKASHKEQSSNVNIQNFPFLTSVQSHFQKKLRQMVKCQ